MERAGAPSLASGRWWRRVTAFSTLVVGLLTLASALTPVVPWRARALEAFEPDAARTLGGLVAVGGGAVIVTLAAGMLAGRRRAPAAALPVLCILAAAHAIKGLDYEEATLVLLLAALLRAGRRGFDRDAGVRPALLGAAVALATAAAGLMVALGGLVVTGGHHPLRHAVPAAAHHLVHGGRWLDAHPAIGLALTLATLASGWLFVHALLGPVHAADGHTAAEHGRASTIVARWGDDSLAPFALREDKAFFFAHGGLVAYRTLRGTAVVSGDPIGPPGAEGEILAAFAAFAARRGWDVVVTAVSERHLEAYCALGLSVLQIGNEAVVDPARFTLEGRAVRKLRQAVTRLGRRGWSTEVVAAPRLDAADVQGIGEVDAAWRAGRPRLQGFAMAMDRLWGAPEDAGDVYVLARDPSGDVRAFLRFVRYRRGLSLDAMRRPPDAPNGLAEALVARALAHAQEEGVAEVSLNFAGFAHVMAANAALSRGHRLLRWALGQFHGRFQLERLVAFSEKFSPEWRPRYLVHSSAVRLPVTALRVLQAEAYVRPPPGRPRAGRWQPEADPVRARAGAATA
jgi:lysyl-tRNA synthetase class 2